MLINEGDSILVHRAIILKRTANKCKTTEKCVKCTGNSFKFGKRRQSAPKKSLSRLMEQSECSNYCSHQKKGTVSDVLVSRDEKMYPEKMHNSQEV